MQDRRRHKRLPLEVSVVLERLEQDSITTTKFLTVEVVDLSRSGIGFLSHQKLDLHSYFDAKLKIWTGEVLEVIINIVRQTERDGQYFYGGTFVGMTNVNALKLDIYQMLQDKEDEDESPSP